MPVVRINVKTESDTDQFTAELQRRVNEVVADTAEAIADGAYLRAPVRTGFLKSSIGHDDESAWANAHYASYVNYGTRWAAAQPFFSEAVAHDGLNTLRLGLTSIFGTPPSLPLAMDDTVYLMGPLRGVPETWPHRDLSPQARLRRQRRRLRLGYGDSRYRPNRKP